MKTEELKALGLNDEQIAAVMKQNGQDVENVKAKFADYEDVKKQLGEAGKTIEGLKASAGNAEAIQKAADEWKAKAEKAEADGKARVEAMRFDYTLEKALTAAGARNAKAVRALLDVNGLKLAEGAEEISGLKEQLEKVKGENDYLFAAAEINGAPKFSKAIEQKQDSSSDDFVRSVMGLPPKK